ncbi:MAG: hypothetical protein ACRDT6_09380 [Micromonosporaceae bacterium]
MGIFIAVVLVASVLVVIGVVLLNRRQQPAAVVSPEDAGVPTFRVVALGPRGAGKTLLLASMYNQMQTPSGRSYFLTAPYDQVVRLNQVFTEVADPSLDWPSGTTIAETRDFTFTVRTRGASGNVHTVMGIDYLEYAGGLLTDVPAPGSTAQAQLLQRIDSAHGLIGIIDGYRVRQCLDGHQEGQLRLQQSLTAMISLMMLASAPVTFVITKWDLLREIEVDEDSRLRLVRKYLMTNSGFRDLVEAHSASRVVRLIPVSAVGPDFAELDPDGRITKLPYGQMHPTNVDMPLSAVVPDVFEQIERSLDRAQLQSALQQIRRQTRVGPAAAVSELGGYVAHSAAVLLTAFAPYVGFLGDAAVELFRSESRTSGDRQARLDQQLGEVDERMEELRTARRRVLRELQSRVDVLEGRLPSSRLTGED